MIHTLRRIRKQILLALIVGGFLWIPYATHGGEPCMDHDVLLDRFQAEGSPISVTYKVYYRLLALNLIDIANAHVKIQTGQWENSVTGKTVPAMLITAQMDTHEAPKETDSARIALHDRIAYILSLPELDTLILSRAANQTFTPFFSKTRHNRHQEVFNYETGTLLYRREEAETGMIYTTLEGMPENTRVGEEIGHMLKVLAMAWPDISPFREKANWPRLTIEMDRRAQIFATRLTYDEAPDADKWHPAPALRATIRPAPEDPKAKGEMNIWAIPIYELQTSPNPQRRPTPSEMFPLAAEYNLAVGSLRIFLSEVNVQ